MDKLSFILGMITAFSECAAAGCKRMALSPPLKDADYEITAQTACEIIQKHGLVWYHERNEDMPREKRFHWLVIAARQETIDQYLALRRQGLSPAVSLAPFSDLLSYRPEQGVHTGYDAYREFFPLSGEAQAE